jgi:hypothetical protein
MDAAADSVPREHAALLETAAARPIVLDIAWERPTVAEILAVGNVVGVIRYASTDPTKNLTAAEVAAYHAAGIGTAMVWETTTGRATQGYQAGVDDAGLAMAQRQADGLPDDEPIYAAVDTDTDWPSVADYFRGFHDVVGSDSQGIPLTGPYGGFHVIEGAYADGYRHLWQTLAWSNGQVSSHAVLYQDGRTALGGAADINQVLAPDWGQYPRPEVDMPLTPADVDTILNHRMPGFAAVPGPDGKPYIPTVAEVLNGAKTADSQIAALAASEAAAKAELDQIKGTAGQVLTAVQGILSAGNATVAEVEAGIQAQLAKLGAAIGGIK